MKSLDERLKIVEENVNNNEIIIMIIGLENVSAEIGRASCRERV